VRTNGGISNHSIRCANPEKPLIEATKQERSEDIAGERNIVETRNIIRSALNDPTMSKKLIPGCDAASDPDGELAVSLRVRMGPINATAKNLIDFSTDSSSKFQRSCFADG
jgi:carbon monoxide dehydrogenase subunit G